jgi:hypothetical protein
MVSVQQRSRPIPVEDESVERDDGDAWRIPKKRPAASVKRRQAERAAAN